LQIAETEWTQLLQDRWFPFISLKAATIQDMLAHVRNGQSVDDLLQRIHQEVTNGLEAELAKWAQNPFFKDHMEFLRRAALWSSSGRRSPKSSSGRW
jgi:hypothetical protein